MVTYLKTVNLPAQLLTLIQNRNLNPAIFLPARRSIIAFYRAAFAKAASDDALGGDTALNKGYAD
jgi:hypothetical protein